MLITLLFSFLYIICWKLSGSFELVVLVALASITKDLIKLKVKIEDMEE